MPNPAIGGLRLVLGGNVFGWTADRDTSFAILDAFREAGGRMIDTAEGYSAWVPGHKGGESETMIGEWLASRGCRAEMLIATKTNMTGAAGGLAPARVDAALGGSLERLQTDYIDLYYAHRDDAETPPAEIARGFDALVKSGRVRALGASNFTRERLQIALDAAAAAGTTPYSVLQNQYNLYARADFEGPLQDFCVEHGITMLPFYGLAAGFLTGKYRDESDLKGRARAFRVRDFMNDRGRAILKAMDGVSAETGASLTAIALAWLNAQLAIAAPIASASNPDQVADLVSGATLTLTEAQLSRLNAASAA